MHRHFPNERSDERLPYCQVPKDSTQSPRNLFKNHLSFHVSEVFPRHEPIRGVEGGGGGGGGGRVGNTHISYKSEFMGACRLAWGSNDFLPKISLKDVGREIAT